VLDVGCGVGAFARKLAARGAEVTGIDRSAQRIELARRDAKEAGLDPPPRFEVADARDAAAFPGEQFDAATLVLALQSMEEPESVLRNVSRALRARGRLVIALHHPCFWIPGHTHWGWDPERRVRFRRVDRYRSARAAVPEALEGCAAQGEPFFHWPLERIFSALRQAGFSVVDLVEPVSDRGAQAGGAAADRARREIPFFMVLLALREGGGARRRWREAQASAAPGTISTPADPIEGGEE
jgi:ubiquinone/menaquinone biosynthesis C-methylase UbiE